MGYGKKKGVRLLKKMKEVVGKIGTLNLILMLVGVFFVWFNWQMLEIFRECASIPESYACAVIAATIGECGICGWIRTSKDRQREHQWEQEEKQTEGLTGKERGEMTDERDYF